LSEIALRQNSLHLAIEGVEVKVLSHRKDAAMSRQLRPQLTKFREAREDGLLHDNYMWGGRIDMMLPPLGR
jgi:hypothetical protein